MVRPSKVLLLLLLLPPPPLLLVVDRGRERREMAEESGEGASEAEGLVGGGVNVIWMPCVPMVQSRYEVAFSKSVRSDILASCRMFSQKKKTKRNHHVCFPPPSKKKGGGDKGKIK